MQQSITSEAERKGNEIYVKTKLSVLPGSSQDGSRQIVSLVDEGSNLEHWRVGWVYEPGC